MVLVLEVEMGMDMALVRGTELVRHDHMLL